MRLSDEGGDKLATLPLDKSRERIVIVTKHISRCEDGLRHPPACPSVR